MALERGLLVDIQSASFRGREMGQEGSVPPFLPQPHSPSAPPFTPGITGFLN